MRSLQLSIPDYYRPLWPLREQSAGAAVQALSEALSEVVSTVKIAADAGATRIAQIPASHRRDPSFHSNPDKGGPWSEVIDESMNKLPSARKSALPGC